MNDKESVVQSSYTQALKVAKTSNQASCCSPSSGTEVLIQDIQRVSDSDQSISFGCYRLDSILQERAKQGDTVIDFGSGPGHDLFLAARLVGPTGKAIGVDFTDAMIKEARTIAKEKNLTQVELVKASIDKIPLEDNLADAIISNCVINLAMNKQKVFDEAFRLLKSGGQLIDADIISDGTFTDNIKKNNDLWCSCIGGSLTEEETIKMLEKSGFKDIEIKIGERGSFIFEDKEYGSYSAVIYATKP